MEEETYMGFHKNVSGTVKEQGETPEFKTRPKNCLYAELGLWLDSLRKYNMYNNSVVIVIAVIIVSTRIVYHTLVLLHTYLPNKSVN